MFGYPPRHNASKMYILVILKGKINICMRSGTLGKAYFIKYYDHIEFSTVNLMFLFKKNN